MLDKPLQWLGRMKPAPRPSCICSVCAPDYEFFRVCANCANKRCPKATCHTHECSGSNEPGQIGSSYGVTLCGVKGCKCVGLHLLETWRRAEWAAWRLGNE